MDTPSTIIGVLGTGLALIYIVVKAILSNKEDERKKKAEMDAKIDAISNADDVIRIADRLRD